MNSFLFDASTKLARDLVDWAHQSKHDCQGFVRDADMAASLRERARQLARALLEAVRLEI